jgi:hypothetical protein
MGSVISKESVDGDVVGYEKATAQQTAIEMLR